MIDLYLMLILSFGAILVIAVVGCAIVFATDPRRLRPSDHKTDVRFGAAGSAE